MPILLLHSIMPNTHRLSVLWTGVSEKNKEINVINVIIKEINIHTSVK